MKAKVNGQSKVASVNETKIPSDDNVFQNPYVSMLSYMTEKKNSLSKELKKLKDIENQIIKGRSNLFTKVEIDSVKNIDQVSRCIELMDESINKTNEQVSLYGKKISAYKNSLKVKRAEEDVELLQNFMFLKSAIGKFSESNLKRYTDALTSDLKITKEQVEGCASLANDFNCEKFTSTEEEFKEGSKVSVEKVYRIILGAKKAVVGDVYGRKCKQILVDFAERYNTLEEDTVDIKSGETTIDEGIETAAETPNQLTPASHQQVCTDESNEGMNESTLKNFNNEEKESNNCEEKSDSKVNEMDETRLKENNYRKHNGGRKRWQNRNFNGDRKEGGFNRDFNSRDFNNRDGGNEHKHFNRNRGDRTKRNDNENGEHREERKFNQHYKRPDGGDYARKPLRNGGENRGRFDGQKQHGSGGRPPYNNGFRSRGQNKREHPSGNFNQNGNSN